MSRVLQYLTSLRSAGIHARFLAKIDHRGSDKCWPWLAGTGAGGYGAFKLARGLSVQAHRLSLIIATGRDEKGLEAAHSCNNVLCCNPAHLRWATRLENEADKRPLAEISRLNEQVPA